MGGVDAQADPAGRHVQASDRLQHAGELLDGRPEPEPATGRVLEDQAGSRGTNGHRGQHPGDRLRDPPCPGLDAGAAMRTEVDVHERCSVRLAGPELLDERPDRHLGEGRVGSGKVDQVRSVDRNGRDPELGDAKPEGRQLARRRHPSFPCRRVVGEDLDRVGADLVGALHRADHPGAEGHVRTQAPAGGEHAGIVQASLGPMDDADLAALKALVDPVRLRLLGSLAAGRASPDELARSIGLGRASLDRNVAFLRRAGLVRAGADGALELDVGRLNDLGRTLHGLEADGGRDEFEGPNGEPLPAEEAKVLRGFFERDRLREIPAQEGKRLVVLRYLVDRTFEEDRAYPEKEVNQRLARFHPDVASLRRYMVDYGLVTRAAGVYRRVEG